MVQYSIGFVILHYNVMDVTIESVESIKRFCPKSPICIVDNCSSDGSGILLSDKYNPDDLVNVILLEKNLGFAKGNNYGYRFLRNNYNCKFICVMNNDVFLVEEGLVDYLNEAFETYGFGVLGPKIIMKNGKEYLYDNRLKTKDQYIHDLDVYKEELHNLNNINGRNNKILFLQKAKKKYGTFLRSLLFKKESCIVKINVMLHGCCLFFSNDYIKKFETAFVEKTFLYKEEELLYLRCMRNKLITCYYPKIKIKHMEDVSTDAIASSQLEKRKMKLSYMIDSTQLLISYMEGNSDN